MGKVTDVYGVHESYEHTFEIIKMKVTYETPVSYWLEFTHRAFNRKTKIRREIAHTTEQQAIDVYRKSLQQEVLHCQSELASTESRLSKFNDTFKEKS